MIIKPSAAELNDSNGSSVVFSASRTNRQRRAASKKRTTASKLSSHYSVLFAKVPPSVQKGCE